MSPSEIFQGAPNLLKPPKKKRAKRISLLNMTIGASAAQIRQSMQSPTSSPVGQPILDLNNYAHHAAMNRSEELQFGDHYNVIKRNQSVFIDAPDPKALKLLATIQQHGRMSPGPRSLQSKRSEEESRSPEKDSKLSQSSDSVVEVSQLNNLTKDETQIKSQ